MRSVVECQEKLIALGYSVGPMGADGLFGGESLRAYNQFRGDQGLPAVSTTTLADLNALLFPAPPKKPSWLQSLILSKALEQLKETKMLNFLSGYKTYIVAIIMVLAALAQLIGVDLPTFDGQNAGTLLSEAFAIIFLRKAVSK